VVPRAEGGCTVALGADLPKLVVHDVVSLVIGDGGASVGGGGDAGGDAEDDAGNGAGAVDEDISLDAPDELLDLLDAVARRLLVLTRRARGSADPLRPQQVSGSSAARPPGRR
jgi:hypothetical protein